MKSRSRSDWISRCTKSVATTCPERLFGGTDSSANEGLRHPGRCRGIADESAPTGNSGQKKAGDRPALFLHPLRRSAIHPMALAGVVIVTMVIGHAHVVADLVTVMHR